MVIAMGNMQKSLDMPETRGSVQSKQSSGLTKEVG